MHQKTCLIWKRNKKCSLKNKSRSYIIKFNKKIQNKNNFLHFLKLNTFKFCKIKHFANCLEQMIAFLKK